MKKALDFALGAPFSLGVSAFFISKDNDEEVVQLQVANGVTLSIKTVSIHPIKARELSESCSNAQIVLYFWSDDNPNQLPLCSFDICGTSLKNLTTLPIGIEISGERSVFLKAVVITASTNEFFSAKNLEDLVCVFGCIEPSPWASEELNADAKVVTVQIHKNHEMSMLKSKADEAHETEKNPSLEREAVDTSKTKQINKHEGDTSQPSAQKTNVLQSDNNQANKNEISDPSKSKRARTQSIDLSDSAGNDNPRSSSPSTNVGEDKIEEVEPKRRKLSKKARKELAQQKQKELEEVIAKENGFNMGNDKNGAKSDKKKEKTSLPAKPLSTRMLANGVKVQDIIFGTGPPAKKGRLVSINYIGTFPETGEVFDKNQSRSSPLQFRLGTGQVIRGLDIGMDGMRSGGERIITIPPEMGYGKNGSGKIPKNAVLEFAVKFIK